jgi:hypothetical protein
VPGGAWGSPQRAGKKPVSCLWRPSRIRHRPFALPYHRPSAALPAGPEKPSHSSLRADAIQVPALLVPGLRPVSVKCIQAARRARSDALLTELAPLSPRGRGAGLPAP